MSHNHQHCLTQALNKAEALLQRRGESLTPLRRRVLQAVWANHQAVSAMDLVQRLKVKPPIAYRVLAYLEAQGLVHRLHSVNAFVGCTCPADKHTSQFFICQTCGEVQELPQVKLPPQLQAQAKKLGFKPQQAHLEIAGYCATCAAKVS